MFNKLNDFQNYSSKYKICVIGESNAGKTSILNNICKNNYKTPNPTIGVDFFSKIVKGKYNEMKLIFWDLSGNDNFRPIITSYFRDVDLFILVIDLTTDEFKATNKWIKIIKKHRTKNCPILVVLNKIDLVPVFNKNSIIDIMEFNQFEHTIIEFDKTLPNSNKNSLMNTIINILDNLMVEIDLNEDIYISNDKKPLLNKINKEKKYRYSCFEWFTNLWK